MRGATGLQRRFVEFIARKKQAKVEKVSSDAPRSLQLQYQGVGTGGTAAVMDLIMEVGVEG